ncbi:MAG: hypothetical protein GY838_07480, partial [bacterium]|nr:hypothetical protein [bacterium]
TVFRLDLIKLYADDYVHLSEWELEGLQPACGGGTDLSNDAIKPFQIDIDSELRPLPWDIGADQAEGITAEFKHYTNYAYEAEGVANLEVLLSAPATEPLTLAYATGNTASATSGIDFQAAAATLTIPAGSTRGTISITIFDDGIADDGESFYIYLTDPSGFLADDSARVIIREGDAPVRAA